MILHLPHDMLLLIISKSIPCYLIWLLVVCKTFRSLTLQCAFGSNGLILKTTRGNEHISVVNYLKGRRFIHANIKSWCTGDHQCIQRHMHPHHWHCVIKEGFLSALMWSYSNSILSFCDICKFRHIAERHHQMEIKKWLDKKIKERVRRMKRYGLD